MPRGREQPEEKDVNRTARKGLQDKACLRVLFCVCRIERSRSFQRMMHAYVRR